MDRKAFGRIPPRGSLPESENGSCGAMERLPARPNTLAPPLKWAGGKRWPVPHLRDVWTAHADRRLVEPFCGGLAVALGLGPRRALLNDANPHLVNFYRWLKRGLVVDLPMANERAMFYRHRSR